LRGDKVIPGVLKEALIRTAEKRGSIEIMNRYDSILSDVLASEQMQGFWKKYQKDSNYAAGVKFASSVGAAKEILDTLIGAKSFIS